MQVSTSIQAAIQQKLSEHFTNIHSTTFNAAGGGSINKAYRISFGSKMVFCKINSATKFPHLFTKEKQGLHSLAHTGKIKTAFVVDCFEAEGNQILLLEWIEEGSRTKHFWSLYGEQLAALHCTTNESFGWKEDNYMGSVPQSNQFHSTWVSFFSTERVLPMINRCTEKGLLNKTHLSQFESLSKKLPDIFNEEAPSLLHGDLWSGNFLCNKASEPVLIDPAVYYGHRSVDLAMTTLFGGFPQLFYEAYHHHYPLPSNYREQWAVCNLYPLLIHLYLFGVGYLSQIEHTLGRFA